MLLNLMGAVIGIVNPRIMFFILRHAKHVPQGQKIKHTIDEGFNGRFFSQLTCPCGVQKEFRLHGFKSVQQFVDEIMGGPRKK